LIQSNSNADSPGLRVERILPCDRRRRVVGRMHCPHAHRAWRAVRRRLGHRPNPALHRGSAGPRIQSSGATCIFHTASSVHGLPDEVYFRVNVQGTENIVAAAQKCNVKKLVFTSSTGVVWSVKDIVDVDESSKLHRTSQRI